MDLNDYWQENKRFVTMVAAGFLAFWISNMVIDSSLGDSVAQVSRSVRSTEADLRGISLSTSDLNRAKTENADLESAVGELEGRVAFKVRPGFALGSAEASASNQYFSQVSTVREELSREAGRLGVSIPDDLGLPALATLFALRKGSLSRGGIAASFWWGSTYAVVVRGGCSSSVASNAG